MAYDWIEEFFKNKNFILLSINEPTIFNNERDPFFSIAGTMEYDPNFTNKLYK